jgi:hypothetical protein
MEDIMTLYITTHPQTTWITPERQLDLLRGKLQEKESRVVEEVSSNIKELIPKISEIIAKYLIDPKNYTIWHDSLKALNSLPGKVPLLSDVALKKLEDIGEKHTLMLIPREFGTLNGFREMIMSYAKVNYPKSEQDVFAFRDILKTPNAFFYESKITCLENRRAGSKEYTECFLTDDQRARGREFSNMPFGQTCWELVPRKMLSKKPYTVNYEMPYLTKAIASIFLYYIATGESIYQIKKGKKWIEIQIPVKEKIGGNHVVINYYYENSEYSPPYPRVRCARCI